MTFEGLEIATAADVVHHFRAGTTTHPRDERPWAWILRFAATSWQAKALVAEAVERLVEEEGGPDLRPTPVLDDVMRLASLTGVQTQLPALLRRIATPPAWTEAETAQLLDWLIGAKPAEAPELIEPRHLEALETLGAGAVTFTFAFSLLSELAPWRLARFLAANAGVAADPAAAADSIGLRWALSWMAPYRLEILLALRGAGPELQDPLRRVISRKMQLRGRAADAEPLIDCAWSEEDCSILFAQDLAKTFLQASGVARIPLLVHPRDGDGLDLPTSFTDYAAEVQERAEAYAEAAPGEMVEAVEDVEEARPGASATARIFEVSCRTQSAQGSTTRQVTVYRLGDRFKAALAVPRRAP